MKRNLFTKKTSGFKYLLTLLIAMTFISGTLLSSCNKSEKGNELDNVKTANVKDSKAAPDTILRIAISKHYKNYSKWLKTADPDVQYYDLYTISLDEALEIIKKCDGLLLSGGPDVEPAIYGKPEDSARCEIDFRRDTLEFKLIEIARKLKMPILGICRGEQILNVEYGGTLIVDIPEDFGTDVKHRCKKSDTCFHDITVTQGSLLNEITGAEKGIVNTNHHQAVEKLADGFVASAYSEDGLLEAYEWKGKGQAPENEPFILAVQWHPERLDSDNPLSLPIAKYFLMKANEYKLNKRVEGN